MTTITETLARPDGAAVYANVTIRLAGEDGVAVVGYGPDSTLIGPVRTITNDAGVWEADLVSNVDIVPANTVYRIEVRAAGQSSTRYVSVPVSGTALPVEDLLVDPPGALDPSGLAGDAKWSNVAGPYVPHDGPSVGGDSVDALRLGALAVSRVYLGADLLWTS